MDYYHNRIDLFTDKIRISTAIIFLGATIYNMMRKKDNYILQIYQLDRKSRTGGIEC